MSRLANILLVSGILYSAYGAAETNGNGLYTLFTTPQERQLIDANRYRSDDKPAIEAQMEPAVTVEAAEKAPALEEKVILEVSLSGFTLAQTGQNIAWVNGKPLENGASLDDGSKVFISGSVKPKVQIKTPDGKYHLIAVGETQQLEYLKPLVDG